MALPKLRCKTNRKKVKLNRVYFETRSFQKCQYFEPETPNSWLLAPDCFVSKLQFSLHGRGLENILD